MSITAMHTATTGLEALSTEIDVIANNLANMNTYGFKKVRANFEDLLYVEQCAGGQNSLGVAKPVGTSIGLGTQISNTQRIFTMGSLIPTGIRTDMAIQGDGFFRVQTPTDMGGGCGYTRAGNFIINANYEFVLANGDGQRLDPPITVPADYIPNSVSIGSDGTVRTLVTGSTVPQVVGQVELFRFPNASGLAAEGKNLFIATEASGEAIQGFPGTNGLGQILCSFLESSNVDAVNELVSMIKTQRAFELNSQVITAGNEMLQTITRIR
jgi:flagellar basal-body rod protein FlgG